MKPNKRKVIAITGAESTGKSQLTKELAQYFQAPFVAEYAREYLKDIGLNYNQEDMIHMAKTQITWEKKAVATNPYFLFLDTEAINFKIWFEFYGNPTPDFIEEYIKTKPYSHTLLLYPNTPWIDDGLRTLKNKRLHIHELFEKYLQHYYFSYDVITALDKNRFLQAMRIIEKL